MRKTATIISITGAQQAAIATRFVDAGWQVRGTSRSGAAIAGAEVMVADPDSGAGLAAAMADADVVVMSLPQDHRPGAMPRLASTVAAAAAKAGVGRIVLNMAGTIDEASDEPLFVDMRAARDAVRGSGRPVVVLQPTIFMDNLLQPWSLPAIISDGILAYPAPAEARISWLSHRSLADFVFAAAAHPEAIETDLRIGGPEALTGVELCAVLSARLDRPFAYQRIPLDAFAAGLDQAFGPPAGQRIASLYTRLEQAGEAMAIDGAAARLLGVVPESFAAFAARQGWSL